MTSQQLGCCWVLLIALLSCSAATASEVPAIIVFGDSTVDAGNNNYILTVAKGNFPPYGRDFDGGVATGRFSNGRLVTDFVSEALGLPSSVPAYLDSTYTIDQLATGVSFASGGTGLDRFVNIAQGCCGTGLIETSVLCGFNDHLTCQDADSYVFFDSVHPSERTYQIIANKIINTDLKLVL
uniref:GDSL esterase/lipase n=1 Tax=Oryza meridionalis TaxID=40149 RepID=A0A0E0DB96_9ORYZ